MNDIWVVEYSRKIDRWHVSSLSNSLVVNTHGFIESQENNYQVLYYGGQKDAERFYEVANQSRKDHRMQMTVNERDKFLRALKSSGLLKTSNN